MSNVISVTVYIKNLQINVRTRRNNTQKLFKCRKRIKNKYFYNFLVLSSFSSFILISEHYCFVTVTMLHEGVVTAPGVLAIIRNNFLDIINQQSNTKNADNSPGFMTFRKCFYYIPPNSHKKDLL